MKFVRLTEWKQHFIELWGIKSNEGLITRWSGGRSVVTFLGITIISNKMISIHKYKDKYTHSLWNHVLHGRVWIAVRLYNRFACYFTCLSNLHDSRTEEEGGWIQRCLSVSEQVLLVQSERSKCWYWDTVVHVYDNILQPVCQSDMTKQRRTN